MPTTVYGTSLNVSVVPTTFSEPPRTRRQKPWLMTTASGPPTSACVSPRPRSGGMANVSKNSGVTRMPTIDIASVAVR